MHKNKLFGLILLLLSALLVYLGLNQAGSPWGELNEALTGSYTDETLAYLFAGAVVGAIGLYLFVKN